MRNISPNRHRRGTPVKVPLPKCKWKAKASGANCLVSNPSDGSIGVSPVGKENRPKVQNTNCPITAGQMNVDVEKVTPDGVNNSKLAMGSAVSSDPVMRKILKHVRDASAIPASVADFRDTTPSYLLQVNTTSMEEPLRRLLYPDQVWATLATGQQPHFPAGPIVNHRWSIWISGVHGPRYPFRLRFCQSLNIEF